MNSKFTQPFQLTIGAVVLGVLALGGIFYSKGLSPVVSFLGEKFSSEETVVVAEENTSVDKNYQAKDANVPSYTEEKEEFGIGGPIPEEVAYVVDAKLYDGFFIESGETKEVEPSQELEIIVGAKNVGEANWLQEYTSINVVGGEKKNEQFRHSSWLTALRPAVLTETRIEPNEIGTFSITLNTPREEGEYTFELQLVRQDGDNFIQIGKSFFTLYLNIVPPKQKEEIIKQPQETPQENLTPPEEIKKEEEVPVEQPQHQAGGGVALPTVKYGVAPPPPPPPPSITLTYPTTTLFTYATTTEIMGTLSSRTASITANGTSTPSLTINTASSTWSYTAPLTSNATNTFSFIGYTSDGTQSSLATSTSIVQQSLPTPDVLLPTTSTAYTITTNGLTFSGTSHSDVALIHFEDQFSGLVVTTTPSSSAWSLNYTSLADGVHTLIWYGVTEEGYPSATSSKQITVDTTGPSITSLTQTVSSTDVAYEYAGADDLGQVASYELQFMFPLSQPSPIATCGSSTTTIPWGHSVLTSDISVKAQYQVDACTWFATTTLSTTNTVSITNDMSRQPFLSRVRATDSNNNVGGWVYTDVAEINPSTNTTTIIISEIAWMGTEAGTYEEWFEIHNASNQDIDLTGWKFVIKEYTTSTWTAYDREIDLSSLGTMASSSFEVFERTDNNTISTVTGTVYKGYFHNDSGVLSRILDASGNSIDEVDAQLGWFAGTNSPKATMIRKTATSPGNIASSWCTFTECGDGATLKGVATHLDANGGLIQGSPGGPVISNE